MTAGSPLVAARWVAAALRRRVERQREQREAWALPCAPALPGAVPMARPLASRQELRGVARRQPGPVRAAERRPLAREQARRREPPGRAAGSGRGPRFGRPTKAWRHCAGGIAAPRRRPALHWNNSPCSRSGNCSARHSAGLASVAIMRAPPSERGRGRTTKLPNECPDLNASPCQNLHPTGATRRHINPSRHETTFLCWP